MAPTVSVAVPVLNGGARFLELLAALRRQRLDRPVELVVIDSGSTDGSLEAARDAGATLERIRRADFSHGGTRNRLMELAAGAHVAFLTQDAVPATDGWLAALLAGFDLAEDVALVAGPFLPRPGATPSVRRELDEWFAGFGDVPRVDRLAGPPDDVSRETFFSSANGAVARRAWERIPFRAIPYAEDQRLAVDLMVAGWARAYVPAAAVVHSHAYAGLGTFRRAFDEFRAMREVYDHRESLAPRHLAGSVRHAVGADRAYATRRGLRASTGRALAYRTQHVLGRALGANADRLPASVRGWCSLEGRQTFAPGASS